ncbi:MAG: D-alanyl-D-alanine carboxypeptidase [Desulfosarcina sp.]|nr:D-alanyl-D-alanine carboxypeptidase [Desulfobacterales bacterium]
MTNNYRTFMAAGIVFYLLWTAPAQAAITGLGPRDALLVTNAGGQILLAHNPTRALIPASTLKVVTALAVRHYLGDAHRFKTEFFLDPQHNLWIRGYGDPLLVSEVMVEIARTLNRHLVAPINAILLDDRYFDKALVIPGISSSTNPYDAPNGALCANFNTVNFKTRGGRIISAEPQTPLLPMVMHRIRASGLTRGRIVLSQHGNEAVLYAGELFKYFLKQAGVPVRGPVRLAPAVPPPMQMVYRHVSPFSMDEAISRSMEFSNNFIANQLLIAAGARAYGAPGNLVKGARALNTFAANDLGVSDARLVEGSGISRDNRISARGLMKALTRFEPHRRLMTHKANTFFKTGTLKGIRTRVGYIGREDGRLFRFVLLLNTPGRRPAPILRKVEAYLRRQPP